MSSVMSVAVGAPAQPAGPPATKQAKAGEFGPLLARAMTPPARRGESAAPAGEKLRGGETPPAGAVEGEAAEAAEGEETALEALAPTMAPVPAVLPAPAAPPAAPAAAASAEATVASAGATPAGAAPSGVVPAAGAAAVEGGEEGARAASPTDPPREAEAAVAAAAPTDPRRVENGTERLDADFRARLERVVERMRSEFGHELKIVETVRPQERQNYLFAQGRTRPGPVVTWTRSSNHTLGRAADVMIDGTYDNPKGYAHLAKIAAEEGLRTLGPKDPGHVELPRGARPLPSMAGPLAPVAPEPAGAVSVPAREAGAFPPERVERGMARVAEVARVADVARVAQVAQVAQVARPGRASAPEPSLRAASGGRERSSSEGGETSRSGAEAELLRLDSSSVFAQLSSATSLEGVSAPGGVDAASRIARIMEVRDGAAAAPMGHVLVRLENGTGGEDLIRVDLRGNAVGANIDVANSAEIDQLLARLPELQRALEKHGLETEQLRVRSALSGARDAAEMAPLLTAMDVESARGGAGGRTGSDSAPSRERWENAAQGQARRDNDDPRQQFRRNPKGENKS